MKNKDNLIYLIPIYIFLSLAAPSGAQDYKIGPKDVLKISVYGQPDLEKTAVVTAQGTISFPLLGEVSLAGLTPAQAEKMLVSLLEKDYLVDPQVSVTVAEYKSKKVLVLGEVKNPGAYDLQGETTLLEIISRAGGLNKEAGENLFLVRLSENQNDRENPQTLIPVKISLKKLLAEGEVALNIPLQNEDTLYIAKANSFFVLGEVQRPGSFSWEKGVTALRAVSMAGGFTIKAAPNRTRIVREAGGQQDIIKVNLEQVADSKGKSGDVLLREDDVIIVPESYF